MSTESVDVVEAPRFNGKLYTVEEFEELSDIGGYELIDGLVVVKCGGNESSSVTMNLTFLLQAFVRQHDLGRLHDSEGGYVLVGRAGKTRIRKPDLSFVRKGRYPDDKSPKGYAKFAPDFAFESVSPTDCADDLQEKIEDYLRAAVPLVWIAFPTPRIVLEYRADGSVRRATVADTLSADGALAGFTCPVAELFTGL